MNAFKRFFAMILALCMVLSFVPVSAFAAENGDAVVTADDQVTEGQDIFVLGADNTQGEVKVEHSVGVQSVKSKSAEVAGLSVYVAYDIALYTDTEGTQPYEGKATVSIPLGDNLKNEENLKGFIVDGKDLSYIYDVEIDSVLNTATFEVPHGGIVGVTVMSDEETGAERVENVTVYVGDTTVIDDETGNHASSFVGVGDGSSATVTVADFSVPGSVVVGEKVDPNSNLADGEYILLNYRSGKLAVAPANTGTKLLQHGYHSENTVWKITSVTGGYHIQPAGDTGKYMSVPRNDYAELKTDAVVLVMEGHTKNNVTRWLIGEVVDGTTYFLNEQTNNTVGGWAGSDLEDGKNDDGSQWDIYKATRVPAVNGTTITITGNAVGNTQVRVGNVLYNIDVRQRVQKISLAPGQTAELNDDTGKYNSIVEVEGFTPGVATIQLGGTEPGQSIMDSSAAALTDGGRYYIVSPSHDNYAVTTTTGSAAWGTNTLQVAPYTDAATEANIWTLEVVGSDRYRVKTPGGYLNVFKNGAEISSAYSDVFSVSKQSDNSWTFSNGRYELQILGNAKGQSYPWTDNNSAGGWTSGATHFNLYEVTSNSGSTTVKVTGDAVGTTKVVVGNTLYEISVTERTDAVKNIYLYAGQTLSDKIAGMVLTEADINRQNLSEDVATVSTSIAWKHVNVNSQVTAITSGKTYVLYNKAAGELMNNEWADASVGGDGTDGLGLDSTKNNIKNKDVWIITAVDGGYYVQDGNGKYLTVARGKAKVTDVPKVISLAYDGTDWTIGENGEYLNDFGGAHTAVAGWSDINDGNSQWEIYEVSGDTVVTFNGVASGTGSVRVGYTLYNVTVLDEEQVNVQVKVGETKSFTINNASYTVSDIQVPADADIAEVTLSNGYAVGTAVTELENGKKYIIVNKRAGRTMINTDADSVYAGAGWMNGLKLEGSLSSISDSAIWTIEVTNDGYYHIKDANGKYLSIVENDANLVNDPIDLGLRYTDNGWTIAEDTVYLNDAGKLSTNAAGWGGNGADTDAGSMWSIYEAVPTTRVTIKGIKTGTTTTKIGHVTYNIEVVKDAKNLTVYIGETVVVRQDGVITTGNNNGLTSAATAAVNWYPMPLGTRTGKVLYNNANTEISLEDLEYTFTLKDNGTYSIVDSTGKVYLNVQGIPQSPSDVGALIFMNPDGSVNILGMTNVGGLKYLCVYRKGDNSMQWSSGKTAVAEDPEGCTFYIYGKVADPADSSAEIQGYKRITSVDDIQNGEGYLVAFVGEDGNYYCVAYLNDIAPGKFNNMAKVSEFGYADVSITGVARGTTQVDVDGAVYNITVIPYEKDIHLNVGNSATYEPALPVSDEDIDEFNAVYGNTVTVERTNDGKLKFTGIAVGLVNKALLAGTEYTIVVNNESVDVLSGIGKAQNKPVTQLLLTVGVVYDLNLPDGYTAEFTSSDTNILTVGESDGVINALNAGTAVVSVVIKDSSNTIVDAKEIPVTVCNGVGTDGRLINIYNDRTVASDPYLYLNCADSAHGCNSMYPLAKNSLIEFPEGMHMYGNWHGTNVKEILVFCARPHEGYALTSMFATGSANDYMPVRNADGTSYLVQNGDRGCTYGQDGGSCGSVNHISNTATVIHEWLMNRGFSYNIMTLDEVHQLLNDMVNEKIDGAHLFTRDGTDSLETDLTFISDKLPEVEKVIQGVQDASLIKTGGWTEYQEGNYAKVGEYIFYQITVTQTTPLTWQQDNPNKAALIYTVADLQDVLPGAYFYTKDWDNEDGKWDAQIPENLKTNKQNLVDMLNGEWTEAEKQNGSRTFTFYVAYNIKEKDANHDVINSVELNTTYHSSYSSGNISSAANAEASLKIVGISLPDLVLDFAMPIEISNLTMDHMAHRYHSGVTNQAIGGCKYGTISVVQTAGEQTLGLDDDKWSVIYTPNSVFTGYDVVYLMDASGKLMNYFRVYPASTVYYEESFADFGNATGKDKMGWTLNWSDKSYNLSDVTSFKAFRPTVVGNAMDVRFANQENRYSNYGFNTDYSEETGISNDSQAISLSAGDTATFTFTGTGFEVYGNCDASTSTMAVFLYSVGQDANGNEQETMIKFYQVITTTALYDANLVANSLPLVSVNDLAFGTYKVIVRHTKRVADTTAPMKLDGFRVFGTMQDGDIYYPDEEKNAMFIEMRDEILDGYGIDKNTTSEQIYSASNKLGNVLYLTMKPETTEDQTGTEGTEDEVVDGMGSVTPGEAKDFLENGPKNEVWLQSDHALAFALDSNVRYAQIGLKAPSGYAKVTITTTVKGTDKPFEKTYTITSATDMFYRIPGSLAGSTVVITVEDGENNEDLISLLSVTKLKVVAANNNARLATMDEMQLHNVLNLLYAVDDGNDDDATIDPDDGTTTDPGDPDDGETTDPSDPDDGTTTDPSDPDDGDSTDPTDPSDDDLPDAGVDVYKDTVNRIFGENRFETAFKVADELKAVLGIEKFKNIIIASGTNFADALSGTYLASVKNAPILLSYNEVYNDMVREYIAENLAEDGTVYILGGNAAVPYTMDLELIADGITIKRLAGADRFATNLAILTEAGVKGGEILVCTGSNFADSLSASATGKPILLVYNESGELSVAQKLYLTMMDRTNFTIIGGEKAISAELEKAVSAYGVTNRLAGANRFETSVAIAEAYFTDPQDLVLAYAGNYPDGLCGGALAYAINAPLVLTMSGYETEADAYADAFDVQGGVVLGGSVLISDDSVVEIFGLEKPEEIIVK